jgi:DNA-directed RNA polymerase subunit RPC12/RpoP
MVKFAQCAKCGKAFKRTEPHQTLCSSCGKTVAGVATEDDMLVKCRNYLRDADIKGELVNVEEVAKGTNVPVEKVWDFIHDGLISTLSFDDPKVRAYLLKKEQEREREMLRELTAKKSGHGSKTSAGYHSKIPE